MAHVNAMLREQLDQATAANQQLTADIHKLTQDWQRAREELEHKEAEWREEEQVGILFVVIMIIILIITINNSINLCKFKIFPKAMAYENGDFYNLITCSNYHP